MLFHYNNTGLEKTVFNYTLDNYNHEMIIYKTKTVSKKYIICLSGSYCLQYSVYIKKLIHDLLDSPKIGNAYQLIVLEKCNKTSIIMHKDIVEYINELNKTGIDDLIFMGFSSGGVVASHALSELSHIICNKKIITYDTPYQVMDNVCSFQNNMVRLDYYFYYIVNKIYYNHYNYEDIKSKLSQSTTIYGADKLINLIKDVHGFDDDAIYNITGFNTRQDKSTKIINISCKYDPVINLPSQQKFKDSIISNISILNITNIEKNAIGHCSDMAFDCKYLDDIINALVI